MSRKLGIIVPYRNRHSHLKRFLDRLPKYLDNRNYNYEIIIVQQDNASAFNRGTLCNIGFQEAKRLRCDYVVFHDVDMLPINVDYSFSSFPIHLATQDLPFETYFGGITLFPVEDFDKIDGFSNLYWGWGFEDDDLMYRCIKNNIQLDRTSKKFDNQNRGTIKLNGTNAYITSPNIIKYTRDFSFGIQLTLDKITLDHTKNSDTFTIFSVEGFDFRIFYSSFKRFSVQFFDTNNKFYQLYSSIFEGSQNFLFINYIAKERTLIFYIDGIEVGRQKLTSTLKNYGNKKDIFLGCSPKKEHYFNGSIEKFLIFERTLKIEEIKSLCSKPDIGCSSNYGEYKSSLFLKTYYDSRFIHNYRLIDLSSNDNPGDIFNAHITLLGSKNVKVFHKPKRRKSRYETLNHESNGFLNGRWKDDLTRWNQLRYTNEVLNGRYDKVQDGLSSLEFTLHGKSRKGKVHYLNVGI